MSKSIRPSRSRFRQRLVTIDEPQVPRGQRGLPRAAEHDSELIEARQELAEHGSERVERRSALAETCSEVVAPCSALAETCSGVVEHVSGVVETCSEVGEHSPRGGQSPEASPAPASLMRVHDESTTPHQKPGFEES